MGYSFQKTNTSHYGTVAHSSANSLGTADFCIEGWVYVSSFGGAYNAPVLVCKSDSSPVGWFVEISATTIWVGFGGTSAGVNFCQWSFSFPTGAWRHFAFTRTGTSLNMFVNGVGLGAQTVSGAAASADNTSPWILGSYSLVSSPYQLNGYLSNIRVSKGTRRYTANFTPPTSNLTADGQTVLLTAQSATYVDNSATNATVSSTGAGFTISSFDPFPVAPIVASGGVAVGGAALLSQTYLPTGGVIASGAAIVTQENVNKGIKLGGSGKLRWCSCPPDRKPSGISLGGSASVYRPNPYDVFFTVLPLDEQGIEATASYIDRCNDNDGTPVGDVPVAVRGVNCQECNYFENSLIVLQDFFPTDNLTVSCLVRPHDERKGSIILGQATVACGISFSMVPRAVVDTDFWGTGKVQTGTWTHLAFRFEGNQVSIFRNGVKESTDTYDVSGNSSLPIIGQQFRGYLQELRIGRAFTDEWIATEFESLSDCEFLEVGGEIDSLVS